jgi:hypothetical protein
VTLAEEGIVAGLTGRPGPTFPGERFAFVAYNSLLQSGVDVRAEGPTPFLALLRGVRQDCSQDRNVPAYYALQLSEDGFLLSVAENQAFSFETVSCYLSDDMLEGVLPGARCLFAWDADPPRQEEGFGLFALRGRRPATSPGFRSRAGGRGTRPPCSARSSPTPKTTPSAWPTPTGWRRTASPNGPSSSAFRSSWPGG